jgi:hypothetical protein
MNKAKDRDDEDDDDDGEENEDIEIEQEDGSNPPKFQSPEEQIEGLKAALMYWQNVLTAAYHQGIVYLEAFVCEKCKKPQYAAHKGGCEILKCEKCGHCHASKSPRVPRRGEVRLEHANVAVSTLTAMYNEKQKLLAPISDEEFRTQTKAVKHLIARMETQAGKDMLKRFTGLTEAIANTNE